jgi:uncharacterized repeat protein (TIGR03803 family)
MLLCGISSHLTTAQTTQFWLANQSGGSDGIGEIYSTDSLGQNLDTIFSFTKNTVKSPQSGLMQASNGKFYGASYQGGKNNYGAIYEWNPATEELTMKNSFMSTNGQYPLSELIEGPDGRLYGTTAYGGTSGKGVIYAYDIATDTIIKLASLADINLRYSASELFLASNGLMYGTTFYGGNTNNYGGIFKFDYITDSLWLVHEFDNTNGAYAYGGLVQANNGLLYGCSYSGGSSNYGVLYSINPANDAFSVKMQFSNTVYQRSIYQSMVKAPNGKLYGTSYLGGQTNTSQGSIFEYNPDSNTINNQVVFTGTNGKYPRSRLALGSDNKFYGTTYNGGTNSLGILFQFDYITGNFSKKYSFSNESGGRPYSPPIEKDSSGIFYGVTYSGGAIYGTLYKYNSVTDSVDKMEDFYLGKNGEQPNSNFIITNGKVYGTTFYGGAYNYGVFFSYDPASKTYTKIVDFDGNNGKSPTGALVLANNGNIYGTTIEGGNYQNGTIFEYNTQSHTFTSKKHFNNYNGRFPQGSIIQATDGHIYGITKLGGSSYGSMFRYNISQDSIISIYSFAPNNNGSLGYYPQSGIIQGNDGKLYGTTSYGGYANNGTLFKYNLSTNTYSYVNTPKIANTLTQASNGKIYTTLSYGGTNGNGSILEYSPVSDSLIQVYNFSDNNSGSPKVGLVESNGRLYGVAQNNSTYKYYIFKYNPDSNIISQQTVLESNYNSSATIPVITALSGVPASGSSSFVEKTINISSCGSYQSPTGNQYTSSGVYNDTLFSTSGVDTVFTINLTVNSIPNIVFGSFAQSLCSNSSPISLSATPAGGSFSGQGVMGSNFNPNMVTAGTNLITYSIQDSSGCSATDSITITVLAAPLANAGNDQSTFNGGSISLSGQVSGGSGNFSYQWSPATVVASSSSLNTTTTALTSTTVFSLKVNDDTTGCSSTDSLTIFVNGSPLNLNLTSNKATVCPRGQVMLSAGATGGSGNYTYLWSSSPSGFYDSSANIQVNPTSAITYILSINDGASTITDSIQIQVYSPATVSITGLSASYCKNDNSVNLAATPGNGSFTGNGISNNIFDPNAASAGVHTITYSGYDNNGCAFTDSVQTTVYNNPTASFTSPSNFDYCQNTDSVLMTGSPAGGIFSGTAVTGDYFYPSQAQLGVNTMYYTYTDSNGCAGGDNIYMNILATPVVQITGGLDSSYCINEASVQLYAFPSGGTFSGNGISGNSLNFSIGNTGQQTLRYSFTNSNGCSNSDSLSYYVYSAPSVIIDTLLSSSFCKNDSLQSLSALPIGGSFSINGNSINNIDPSTLTAGIHKILYSYTDNHGCSNSDTLDIQINNLPSVSITTPISSAYCSNDSSFTINAMPSGGVFSGDITSNNFNPSSLSIGSKQILYSYTDANGCINTDTINTTVNGIPTVNYVAFGDICENVTSINLTGATPIGGTYSGDGVLSGSFYASIAGQGSHILSYQYTDNNGCSNVAKDTINVISVPTSDFTLPAFVCVNDSALINYTGNGSQSASFIWNFDNGNVLNGSGAGPYNVQWSNGGVKQVSLLVSYNNCPSDTTFKYINVSSTYSYITSVGSTTVCHGDSVTLFANVTPGNSYQWYDSLGAIMGDTLSYFIAGQSGTYYCEVTPPNTCSQFSNSIVVTVKPEMIASFSMDINACTNNMVPVNFNGIAPANAAYNWDFASANIASGSGSGPYNLIWNQDSIYTVKLTITEGSCASETFEKDINIISTPSQITALGSLAFCDGDNVSLSANAGNYSYQWKYNGQFTGDTNAILQAIQGGNYRVKVTDMATNCSSTSDSVVVTVNSTNFNLSFTANPVSFSLPPFNTTINNQTPNSSDYYWNWSFGDGANSTNISPSHQYSYDGLYSVGVVAQNIATGCFDTLTKTNYINCQGGSPNPCSINNAVGTIGNTTICPGDTIKLYSKEHTAGISYQWLKDGVLIGGATDSVYRAHSPGLYQVLLADASCSVFSQPISVTQFTTLTPIINANGSIQPCSNDSMELNVTTAFTSYHWSNGATTPNIFVTTSNSYLVTATDVNGCQTTSQPYVVNASFLAAPEICIVSVDTATNHNIIVWERQNSTAIDSFRIYKESTVAGIYDLIGTQPFNQSSLFEDVSSNTAVQSYRYRITAVDTCGTETAPGNFHRTIHLTINAGLNGSWNLLWNDYEGFNFGSYRIYRGSDSSNLQLLTQIQSSLNSYTDLAPPAGNVYYQLEIVSPHPCYPDSVYSKANTNYNNSRSNKVNSIIAPNTSIATASEGNIKMDLFPNPNKGEFTLRIDNSSAQINELYNIDIYNVTGVLISQRTVKGGMRITQDINLETISKGIYFLRLTSKDNIITTRFIIQ